MSVCVSVLHKDFIILASDSRGSAQDGSYTDKTEKLIEIANGGTLAITGSIGAGQKLARLLATHANPLDVPIADIPDEPPHCFYVDKERRLFEIDVGFGVFPFEDGEYRAIGSGGDIARCSMMKQLGKRAVLSLTYKECAKIVQTAIEDSCKLNLFCGGKVIIKAYKRSTK